MQGNYDSFNVFKEIISDHFNIDSFEIVFYFMDLKNQPNLLLTNNDLILIK